jgi:hypothetical protein
MVRGVVSYLESDGSHFLTMVRCGVLVFCSLSLRGEIGRVLAIFLNGIEISNERFLWQRYAQCLEKLQDKTFCCLIYGCQGAGNVGFVSSLKIDPLHVITGSQEHCQYLKRPH